MKPLTPAAFQTASGEVKARRCNVLARIVQWLLQVQLPVAPPKITSTLCPWQTAKGVLSVCHIRRLFFHNLQIWPPGRPGASTEVHKGRGGGARAATASLAPGGSSVRPQRPLRVHARGGPPPPVPRPCAPVALRAAHLPRPAPWRRPSPTHRGARFFTASQKTATSIEGCWKHFAFVGINSIFLFFLPLNGRIYAACNAQSGENAVIFRPVFFAIGVSF